jgi:hypothetical protein
MLRRMKSQELAQQAASSRAWPTRKVDDQLLIEVPTQGGRSQIVNVIGGKDGDGEPAAFVWSKAAEVGKQDPWALLRLSAELTYGRVAVRGKDIVVLYALYDATAQLAQVGKAVYYVAKAADELEQKLTGGDAL